MFLTELLAEINDVTELEVATTPFEEAYDGEVVGEPITDPFLRKLFSLYLRMEKEQMQRDIANSEEEPEELSPSEELSDRLFTIRIGMLGAILDFELVQRYGHYISPEEWRLQSVVLEVRPGWKVAKIPTDPDADELQEQLDAAERNGRVYQ